MSYPTTLMLIGGGGGSPFNFTGEANGARLEKIGVWVATSRIKAVRAWLSDGRVEEFGIPSGPYKEYTFQAGECISSLSLWGNGAGTRLGAILFKTNKGGQFFVEMTSWGLKTEYIADVGSGYCLGIIGRSGADIDLMGFLFLNQVESAVLTDVEYPNINLLIPDVVVESIESATYTNHSSVPQKETIQSSKEVTKTSTWSISASFTATFTTTVKAGVPGVSDATTGYTFSIGVTGMYGQTHTEKKTETVTTILDVPPKKKIVAMVTIGRAAFDLPYTGTMVITCTNGSVLQYKVNGTYKGVAYTDIKVETQESDLPDSECECVTDQITFFGD